MTQERKDELFDEFISYLCSLDSEQCVEILNDIGVTAKEADELGFFDFITEQLEE